MLRFVIKNTQADNNVGYYKERMRTIDVKCPELESILTAGGHGEEGFETNDLLGVEVLQENQP